MRGIDETWQADLVDMQKYSRMNKGFNYIVTVIDNVSKKCVELDMLYS